MQELIKGVNALATEELIRANNANPLFHSDHEAFGVLDEEVHEATLEADRVKGYLHSFRVAIHCDMPTAEKLERITRIRKGAVLCACEAIQVVAMCDKYQMSKEVKYSDLD